MDSRRSRATLSRTALKVAVTLSVIGAVVGEFVGSDKGLGYVIVSVGLFALVELVERLVCPWYALAREQQEVVEELSVKDLEEGPGGGRLD